jgi:hypothetical protein
LTVVTNSSGNRGTLQDKNGAGRAEGGENAVIPQLRCLYSTTLRLAGELRNDALQPGGRVIKLGGSWKRKQPMRGPSRSAMCPKSRMNVFVLAKRLTWVMSSEALTV